MDKKMDCNLVQLANVFVLFHFDIFTVILVGTNFDALHV